MKRKFSKVLAILLAVCMLPLPFTAFPVSAAATVDSSDVDLGDPLYTVNFNGDGNMDKLEQGWDKNMTIKYSDNGSSVSMTIPSEKWSNVGSQLNGLNIQGGTYTFVFTVTASDNNEEVGLLLDHQTGFVVNPGQNTFRYTDHLNETTPISATSYDGTGELTQTYAVEVAGVGAGTTTRNKNEQPNVTIIAYKLYNLTQDESGKSVWNLAADLADYGLEDFFFDWGYAGDCDANVYARFSRDRKNYNSENNGTITVSNFKVYDRLAITPDIVDADPLYTVNFNGDGNMDKLETQGWDKNMTIKYSDNGSSVSMTIPSGKWSNVGSQLKGLNIQGGVYTFVFTVTASDNNEEVGLLLDHQTGFVVNPGQNTFRYTDRLNGTTPISATSYDGTGELTQTYAIEVAGEGEGTTSRDGKDQPNVTIIAYKLYNLTRDESGNSVWNLACELTDDQLKSFFFDWGYAGDCDANVYARFSRDRKNYNSENNGTITVSNFAVYENLVVSEMLAKNGAEIYYQRSIDGRKIRMVGVIELTAEELDDYSELGFDIVMSYNGNKYVNTVTTRTVYTSIIAGGETIFASEYGGTYFYALEIADLDSAFDDVVFDVKSIAFGVDEITQSVLCSRRVKLSYDAFGVIPELPGYSYTDVDTGDNCYMRSFSSISKKAFDSYCNDIAANGFTLYAEKNIDGNIYNTYVNEKHVITTIYTEYNSYAKVLVEPRAVTALPAKAEDNVYTSVDGCETTITQVGLYRADDYDETYNGMCYIIRLADGSFIIVDGGVDTTKERYEDRIYNILKKQAPDPDNIVIAAWLFSHAHDDHVDIFEYFCESYADKVTVERFIYNLPSSEQASAANDKWDRSAKVREWMDEYFPDVPKTKAHPGQTFYIRNAKIDILYTLDVYESALTDFNNSSVVFAIEAEGQKMMFLGDYMDEGKTLMSLYSAQTLKSDIVQITHHGIGGRGGAINNLYKAIAPTYAFWPGLRIYEHNTYRDLYNEAENQYIVKNSEIFMAEDNVHVFTVKDCTVEVYDTVAAYLAS